MRFRSANIRLSNRRSNPPRLLLTPFFKNGKNNHNDKNNPTDVQASTGLLHICASPIQSDCFPQKLKPNDFAEPAARLKPSPFKTPGLLKVR
jgi:hypothetical protein